VAGGPLDAQLSFRPMKLRYILTTAAFGAAVIVPATPALATTTTMGMTHSGTLTAYVNPVQGAGLGTIYITGVIGDYGTNQNITATGTPNANGNYARIVLSKGGFWVNLTTLNKISNDLKPVFYPTTCEAYFTGSAPIQLSHGSGAYAGISGTLTVSQAIVFIAPRLKSGACNMSQTVNPVHTNQVIIATGHVTY
jgi:hypothetical protein